MNLILAFLTTSEWFYTIVIVAYLVTVLSIIAVVISENRNPVKSLAWVTAMLFLPVVGMVLYAFFGRNLKNKHLISRKKKLRLRTREPFRLIEESRLQLSDANRQQIRLARSLTGATYYPGNKIDILTDGREKFDTLKRDIANARSYVHVQYYIFEDDNLGHEIKDLLVAKAREGVKVRVIYDHVGSFPMKKAFIREMKQNGVEVQPFLRVTFPQLATRINWRNHRKITVIDGEIGYIGGMNIADRYIDGGKFACWRDTHLRIVGPAVSAMQYYFAIDWNFTTEQLLEEHTRQYDVGDNDDAGIQLVTSGPNRPWSNISLLFLKAISNARHRIYIQTPYFLPTESLLKALQSAALAKVDVRVMIPRRCDSVMLRRASYSYVGECLRAGIKMYLYDKGMLHAKTVIVDDEFSSTGSTNFDFRSFEHNFECNAFVYSREVNSRMAEIFMRDLDDCTRINPTAWRHRPAIERYKESLVRLLSPIL